VSKNDTTASPSGVPSQRPIKMVRSLELRRDNVAPAFLLILALIGLGVMVAARPTLAWVVSSAVIGLVLIEVPPSYWATGAIAAACIIRVGVRLGLPSFLDFAHYPLMIGGLLVLVLVGVTTDTLTRKLGTGLLLLLLITVASWALNGGEPQRPVLMYLVFFEPFLILFLFLASRPRPAVVSALKVFLYVLSGLQLAIGIWQYLFVAHGNPDLVEGTFIGQGAGAHVAGGVALIGVLVCIAHAAFSHNKPKWPYILAAGLIFVFPVLADAKQAIVCFVPGLIVIIVLSGRLQIHRLIAPAVVGSMFLYVAYLVYPPLQMVTNTQVIEGSMDRKITGVKDVLLAMGNTPAGWFVGVGPGNSISRVALLTRDAQVKPDSPVARLGLKTSPLTLQLLRDDSKSGSLSSIATTASSWLGLLGDLGPLGLATYLWLCSAVWSALSRIHTANAAAARAGMIMAGLLGLVFSWLEEPGFILALASLMALALLEAKTSDAVGRGLERPSAF
jgi:hypothetical protein